MQNDIKNQYIQSIGGLSDKKMVFFGTGGVGKKFYKKYCLDSGILPKPCLWCDNDKVKQGAYIDGVPIISPDTLKKEMSSDWAIIITTGVSHMLPIISQLHFMGLGLCNIYAARHLDAFFYFRQHREEYHQVVDMLYDQKSKILYKQFIDNLIYGRPVAFDLFSINPYFGNDVIPNLKNEIIVDAGICQGEEIDRALHMDSNAIVHAFEPQHVSFEFLKRKYKKENKVVLYKKALWDKYEKIPFDCATVSSAARIANSADLQEHNRANIVEAVALDDMEINDVTLLKMDIEGAEYNALLGAKDTIKKFHPKLAICCYHKIEDYLELPILINKISPQYQLYFRQHSILSDESVVYAL